MEYDLSIIVDYEDLACSSRYLYLRLSCKRFSILNPCAPTMEEILPIDPAGFVIMISGILVILEIWTSETNQFVFHRFCE